MSPQDSVCHVGALSKLRHIGVLLARSVCCSVCCCCKSTANLIVAIHSVAMALEKGGRCG